MKIKQTSDKCRVACDKRRGTPLRHPSPVTRHAGAERGIALVITLILLSVTLIMAVAFLALSRRERSAVATTTDTAAARLAVDSALAAAQAQIAANIFTTTNLGAYNFKLLVSTNYINSYGLVPGVANPTNVNYDYVAGGGALNANDLIQNIANLWLLPRAPVFVVTNQVTGAMELRYYLDLNRNGRPEGNGRLPLIGPNGGYLHTNGVEDNTLADVLTNNLTGDPEWIGVLERPDQPHGPNNPFVARYAFFAQPIGNALDLNFIHNAARLPIQASFGPGDFRRNQGVGSWELNLGAFFNDLNTNTYAWDASTYIYDPLGLVGGDGFIDAASIYSYRLNGSSTSYAYNPTVLKSAVNYFGGWIGSVFGNDFVDAYADGPFQMATGLPADNDLSDVNYPWPGSDNNYRFFSLPSDLFDTTKTSAAFTNRLLAASTHTAANGVQPTYDRYTFYRMLDQMGTDTSADEDKMNLNYDNLDFSGTVVPGAETNMFAWTPERFFTNAANRMLLHYTGQWRANAYRDFTNTFGTVTTGAFDAGNIPVFVEGRFVYTPAVNRLLQLAANLYDATTNGFFPHTFRPVFRKVTTNGFNNIYISGFHEITTVTPGSKPLDEPLDITDPALDTTGNAVQTTGKANAYGVPWIVGAKKGLPNFNQFMSMSTVRVTRKLQLQRTDATQPGGTASNPTWTNQMFLMSITNRFGVAFWNSYSNNYVPKGNLIVHAQNRFDMSLTNDQGLSYNAFSQYFYYNPTLAAQGTWPGSAWTSGKPEYSTPSTASFLWSAMDYGFLPESQFDPYSLNPNNPFRPISATVWYRNSPSVALFPQFGLLTTNRLQAYIVDAGRVIDYVHFSSTASRDLDDEIQDKVANDAERQAINNRTAMWDTNTPAGVPYPARGVENQIYVSRYNPAGTVAKFWKNPANMPPGVNTPALEAAFFNAFFMGGGVTAGGKFFQNTNQYQQAPYTPTRTAWDLDLWQANDPLVHHLSGDLVTVTKDTGVHHADDLTTADYPRPAMDTLTDRYQPWGRGAQMDYLGDVLKQDYYDSRFRDPLVWRSDNWDFPTNKMPSVGWIGRVHRGTPWQTVYLKSRNILADTTTVPSGVPVGTNTWAKWTGNSLQSFGANNYWDAANASPVKDGMLFDLFTTRFNENSARGTLSVNAGAGSADGGLAAWSAVLSGVVALTNTTVVPSSSKVPAYTNLIISPAGAAGIYSPVGLIVTNLNAIRSGYVTGGGLTGAFTSVGDILRVPALTDHSPFLNWNDANQQKFGISDELYEWLPQQIMGLLRVSNTPRYAIYCYGQALRPASGSQVLSGGYFQMITNYQVVAESAARTVIRFDKQGTNYTATVESYNPLPPD